MTFLFLSLRNDLVRIVILSVMISLLPQNPIDSLRDVLESGLPWGMVLYGEEEEQMMASSPEGSDIRTIWDEKIIKPYSPTVAEVDSVLAGDLIFIDWKSGLEPAIFSKYSTPSGDPLVHLSSRPVFMPNYPGWGFFKFNPWRAKFDEWIMRHREVREKQFNGVKFIKKLNDPNIILIRLD